MKNSGVVSSIIACAIAVVTVDVGFCGDGWIGALHALVFYFVFIFKTSLGFVS